MAEHQGGIYQITNTINGKRYIGSTSNLHRRKGQHLAALRKGRHHTPHLQAAFTKYGERVFLFTILERCSKEELIPREQWYLDNFNPEYNHSTVAGASFRGHKHTPETKARMSARSRGIPKSPEHCAALSRAQTGLRRDPDVVARIAEKRKGYKHSEEARLKMREHALNRSAEHLENLAEAVRRRWAKQHSPSD